MDGFWVYANFYCLNHFGKFTVVRKVFSVYSRQSIKPTMTSVAAELNAWGYTVIFSHVVSIIPRE